MAQLCVNGTPIESKYFAYDGCHKLYVCESDEDKEQAKECDYDIYPIEVLPEKFEDSCCLRFIRNWSLTKRFVGQGEEATFTEI